MEGEPQAAAAKIQSLQQERVLARSYYNRSLFSFEANRWSNG